MAMAPKGNSALPIPATVQVHPSGSRLRKNIKASGVPGIAPGTPRTKSKCWGRSKIPSRSKVNAFCTIPLSKTSTSGFTPCSTMVLAKVLMSSMVLTKRSLPKLTLPVDKVAISGFNITGCKRSWGVIPTAPPVDTWTIHPGHLSRMPEIISPKTWGSWVDLPSGLRACRCTMLAPACQHRQADSIISGGETGRLGLASLLVSAPVRAAVIINLSMLHRLSLPLLGYNTGPPGCGHHHRRIQNISHRWTYIGLGGNDFPGFKADGTGGIANGFNSGHHLQKVSSKYRSFKLNTVIGNKQALITIIVYQQSRGCITEQRCNPCTVHQVAAVMCITITHTHTQAKLHLRYTPLDC